MQRADVIVVAVWSATIFGFLEGILLNIARVYPVLLAPYKASAHILWVAPLVDLVFFLIAAAGLLLSFTLLHRWLHDSELLVTYGFFGFCGIFTLLEALKLIHPISVALLATGLTVALCRIVNGHEAKLTRSLRRRLRWVPILVIAMALGVYGYEIERERRHFGDTAVPAAKYFNSQGHSLADTGK